MVRSSHWIKSFVNLLDFRDFHSADPERGRVGGKYVGLLFKAIDFFNFFILIQAELYKQLCSTGKCLKMY